MHLTYKDGFSVFEGRARRSLWIESARFDECLRYLDKSGITEVTLNSIMANGYKLDDCAFFAELPHITGVKISGTIGVRGLVYLRRLKHLVLDGPNQALDLSQFTHLSSLSLDWHRKIQGLATLPNLERLQLWKYKPESRDLKELSGLSALRWLRNTQSPIETLDGIGALTELRHFGGCLLPKLHDISEIASVTALEDVEFQRCRRMTGHEAVFSLPRLTKLLLLGCGEIASIAPVENMRQLTSFVFMETNVTDGDMTPLIRHEGLEHVAFTKKPHFSHSHREVLAVRSGRQSA